MNVQNYVIRVFCLKETLDVWIVILKHHFGAIAVGFSGEIGEEIIDEGEIVCFSCIIRS